MFLTEEVPGRGEEDWCREEENHSSTLHVSNSMPKRELLVQFVFLSFQFRFVEVLPL